MSDHASPSAGIMQVPAEVKTDHFREIYANFSRVGMTPWDLGLMFGTVRDAVPGQPAAVNSEVLVRMSPQQFKVFANSLPLIMAAWEARFGEISLDKQFMTSVDAIKASIAASEKQSLQAQTPAASADKPTKSPRRRS